MDILKSTLKQPVNVNFESQEKDETLYYILRKHPVTNLGWIFMTIMLLIIPIIMLIFFGEARKTIYSYFPENLEFILVLIWYSFTFFLTFEAFLLWYFNVYIITNKRVIDVDFSGLWKKRISEAPLDNVQDASYETNHFLHILFDYGDIVMQTASEKREFEFHGIPKPAEVHDLLTNLVENYKKKRHG